MWTKSRYAPVLLLWLLGAGLYGFSQLRPDVNPATTRPAAPKTGASRATQIVIQTEPRAQIYFDDIFKGQTSSQGRVVIDSPQPGDHNLRVSLPGKQDYEQKVTVVSGQIMKLTVTLPELAGTIVIRTTGGAEVFLDESSRGLADGTGKISIPSVAPGSHELRVSAAGKKDYRQSINVVAGQESKIQAPLAGLAGTLVIQTSPGATVFLDESSRGTTDANGQLLIGGVDAGSHELRVTALVSCPSDS